MDTKGRGYTKLTSWQTSGVITKPRLRIAKGWPAGVDEVRVNMAVMLDELGRLDEARELLEAAAAMGDELAYRNLGDLNVRLGLAVEAEAAFVKGIKSGNAEAHLDFGDLLLATGRSEEAWATTSWLSTVTRRERCSAMPARSSVTARTSEPRRCTTPPPREATSWPRRDT